MKLRMFRIRKFQRRTVIILFLAVISLNSPLKEDENYYRQVFFKEYRCIKKKVVRHIIDELESSSDDSDDSNDSDEEFGKNNFEGTILKIYFLRKQF